MEKHELIEILKMYKGEPSELCEKPIPHGFDLNDPAVEAAKQLMSMYQAYIQVGFTPDQATKIVCETVYATTVAALCKKK